MPNLPALIPELKVLNYPESLNFYIALAGFELLYDRPEHDFAMLGMNGAQLMIEGISGNRTWLSDEMSQPFGRGMNLQIEVPDIEALYARFKNARYPLFAEPEEKWYRVKDSETGHRQLLVQDPDGYLLRFFERMP